MKKLQFLSLFLLALTVGYIPALESPPPIGKSVEGPVLPSLEGKSEVDYLAIFKLKNAPPATVVFWDVSPEDGVEVHECETDTTFIFGGPARTYTVKARGTINGKKFDLRKQVTIAKGGTPDPTPGPGPLPPVPPPPPPTPSGKVAYFVVVEDSGKPGQWRGDILGSRAVQAQYQLLQGSKYEPIHRLIDVRAHGPEGAVSDEVKEYLEKAKGKELPWLWTLDAAKKPITDMKCPLTPETFVEAIGGSQTPRSMGNIVPEDDKLKYKWPVFGDAIQVPGIPRDLWKEVDLSGFLPPVKDQDGVGACNAFAGVTALEGSRKQAGLPYKKLSPGYLYGNINGQRDQGSILEDGMQWLMEHGTCTADLVPELSWRRNSWPSSAAAEARNYQVVEAYVCPNFDAMASAVQQGFFIVEGLMWYDNFKVDRDGWLPARGTGRAGGHALCGYGLAMKKDATGKPIWGIRTRNSWGTSWGIGGNCIIPESLFSKSIGGFWAVRVVTQTSTDFLKTQKLELNRPEKPFGWNFNVFRPEYTLKP